ncbi:MAG TPA: hypothetical protein VMA13_06235 [Candidatus Saccharimonadales bacterium]|nr:hypothetical protein [Candidatus Saccharimonadales bacterium]
MFRARCLRDFGCAAVLFGIFCGEATAQLALPDMSVTRSVSGQFIVTGGRQMSRLAAENSIATNTDFVCLEPALLAVSAERIKRVLWRDMGVNPSTPWSGKIFLVLHPARSLDEEVTILSEHFADGWDYRVALPDVLSRTRFLRAMTGVALLEFANRGGSARSAEIPAWLTDGLSQQLLASGTIDVILSSPSKTVDGLLESQTVATAHGIDPLADARRILRDHPALTFERLSWPTDSQLSGADGGVYRASAQLFVSELLKLRTGPADMRAMLQMLPRYYNWQMAFQKAFRADFARPLDVEKWWALRVVNFIAHSPGPTWTPAVSREKLNQILSVAVDFRSTSNALPMHAEVSLQAVIRNFDSARQTAILQTKLRDLEMAQFRMARALAVLTAEYRTVIADYLGENREIRQPPWSKHPVPQRANAHETLQKLDALDAQRRTVESAIKPDVWRPEFE